MVSVVGALELLLVLVGVPVDGAPVVLVSEVPVVPAVDGSEGSVVSAVLVGSSVRVSVG